MFITKKRYNELKIINIQLEKEVHKLEKEVQRLAEELSGKTTDCNVGAWCRGCKYERIDSALTFMEKMYQCPKWIGRSEYGDVRYCGKHLHEICPERETV